MNRAEAIKSMEAGYKVTHSLFSKGEYIKMENGALIDESGINLCFGQIDFWADRLDEMWDTNWNYFDYNEDSLVYDQKRILKLDRNFHVYIHGNPYLVEFKKDDSGKFLKIYYKNIE